jgi:hypothetical protein
MSLFLNSTPSRIFTSKDTSKSVNITISQKKAEQYLVLLLKMSNNCVSYSTSQYQISHVKQAKISCSSPFKNIKGTVKIRQK